MNPADHHKQTAMQRHESKDPLAHAPASGVEAGAAYPHRLDAVVLAGTHRNPRRLIEGRNKAFLEIDGRPLVRHVVDALLAARTIREIFVVGPVAQLGLALRGVPSRVRMVQQEGKMLTNTWAGIYAAEGRRRQQGVTGVRDRPLLIISSDLPLISPRAVDDFVVRCAAEDRAAREPFAMMVGVVDEPGVKPFYPGDGKEGIVRPFVELNFGRLRLANIYVARPRYLSHQEFLQTGFSYRKAKDWRNVLSLAMSLFRQPGGWQAAWLTLRLQLTLWSRRCNRRLYAWLREGNTRERIERGTGVVLGGRIRIVTTPFGGFSLDVDDPEDYRVLQARFDDWIAIHDATPPR